MEPYVAILHIAEIGACIAGFVYYKKVSRTIYRWFPWYLLFVVVSEIIGEVLQVQHLIKANQSYFNYLEIPVEFLFFFRLFYFSFRQSKYKFLPVVCIVLYLCSWLTDIFYLSRHAHIFYSFSYTFGNLLLLVLILLYFIQLVTSEAILTFRQNMLFWISFGLLLFYLGSFPYYGLSNTLALNYSHLYVTYNHVVNILNSLMYVMFTFSFIWGRPNTTSL